MKFSIESVIVGTPERHREWVERALRTLTPADAPALRALWQSGLSGDWRRALVCGRMEELENQQG